MILGISRSTRAETSVDRDITGTPKVAPIPEVSGGQPGYPLEKDFRPPRDLRIEGTYPLNFRPILAGRSESGGQHSRNFSGSPWPQAEPARINRELKRLKPDSGGGRTEVQVNRRFYRSDRAGYLRFAA